MSLGIEQMSEPEHGPQSPSPASLHSDSELSDVNDPPVAASTTVNRATGSMSDEDALHEMATSDMDADDDALGEDDADFDEEMPTRTSGHIMQDRSPSESSSSLGKRKADEIDDEEYMKQNPELYGLRRSVCCVGHLLDEPC